MDKRDMNEIREILKRLRESTKNDASFIHHLNNNINEASDNGTSVDNTPKNDEDGVPYTSQDTLMTNVLSAAKQEFGADFNKIKNPMIYYPKDGDITLSGIIPQLNDAKFQFRYKVADGAGNYLWANPFLPVSENTLKILQKVYAVCDNWRNEISQSEDCRPSNYKDPEDMRPGPQGQAPENSGDDMDNGQNQQPGGADPNAQANGAAPGGPNGMQQMNGMMEHKIRRGDDIVEKKTRKRIIKRGDDLD